MQRFTSFLLAAVNLCALPYSSTAAAANTTYLHYDQIKCPDASSPECYEKTYCALYKTNVANTEAANRWCDAYLRNQNVDVTYFSTNRVPGSWSSSVYALKSQPTDTVFIFIHGLWTDAEQFKAVGTHFVATEPSRQLQRQPANAIYLTLPGHGDDLSDATSEEWLTALEDTLKTARLFGQRTVVVGQSTGGLLAVAAALKYSQLVDGIVLIEPALEVRPTVNAGVCLSQLLPDSFVRKVEKLIHQSPPDGRSLFMGCEVQKLAEKIFVEDLNSTGRHKLDPEDYARAAQQLKIPVLMINNENDQIVSAKTNRIFYEALTAPKEYISINLDQKVAHGAITKNALWLAQQIAAFIN